jgi:hypothetical protein
MAPSMDGAPKETGTGREAPAPVSKDKKLYSEGVLTGEKNVLN